MLLSTFSPYRKKLAVTLLVIFSAQWASSLAAYALTSGPTQPEVQGFTPVSSTEMVDLFSGDFSYNIPLFELPGPNGGYPFNLAYRGGVGLDQEASWVGLGWSLNPGAINRQMRGLPDEFNGEEIVKELDMKPTETISVDFSPGVEVAGVPILGRGAPLTIRVGAVHDNYRGFGLTRSVGVSATRPLQSDKSPYLEAQLSIGQNTLEGVNLSDGLSLNDKKSFQDGKYTLGGSAGFDLSVNNGMAGFQAFASGKLEGRKDNKEKVKNAIRTFSSQTSFGTDLSLTGKGYTPLSGDDMVGDNYDFNFEFGPSAAFALASGNFTGNVQGERVMTRIKKTRAFGYLNLQNANSPFALADLNREKDGMVSGSSRFLPIPNLTYDIYSVNGQGMSAMYRPYRSEVGTVGDPLSTSITMGNRTSVELGTASGVYIGTDIQFSQSLRFRKRWTLGNTYSLGFVGTNPNGLFEPVYFKTFGELTPNASNFMDYMGGDQPLALQLDNMLLKQTIPSHGQWRFRSKTQSGLSLRNLPATVERENRNVVIQPILNEQLGKWGGVLGEYNVRFFNQTANAQQTFDRQAPHVRPNHIGGYTVQHPDGLRYIYALPAYNRTQVETVFSRPYMGNSGNGIAQRKWEYPQQVAIPTNGNGEIDYQNKNGSDKSDQYFQRTTIPAFPHAYLLTSLLGNDYVDADNIPGPSDGDLGYWVKFNYVRTSENYKWRAPFHQANYHKGGYHDPSDDRASYNYGEKEIWYLASVETQSHIAIFKTSPRTDGRGAQMEIQNAPLLGDQQYKLDRIELYTKAEYQQNINNQTALTPVVSINMGYDYSLCQGVPNQPDPQQGKLTLKTLAFEYRKSKRGALSPYKFSYYGENDPNLAYNRLAYDRWGNAKPRRPETVGYRDIDFPYVKQDAADKIEREQFAEAWNLREVTTPSGAQIEVKYEPDDYAYVQNKTAMQMTRIAGVGPGSEGNTDLNAQSCNPAINRLGDQLSYSPASASGQPKVYFELHEQPTVAQAATTESRRQLARQYLDNTGQVYFKLRMHLKNASEEMRELVTGYADIDLNVPGAFGIEKNVDANDCNKYYGFVRLKPVASKKGFHYHPFSVAAWQHLELHLPQFRYVDQNPANTKVAARVKMLITALPTQMADFVRGYYQSAFQKNWGNKLELADCFLKLNNVKGKKFGGGSRVSRVTLNDRWDDGGDSRSYYGQVYDYTTQENGRTISSGVAAYEPMQGGDEIAVRRGIREEQTMVLRSNQVQFKEYPFNEDFFPDAQVGYSKVTVKSLASAVADQYPRQNLSAEMQNYFGSTGQGTTGAVVHEFYTAKDFPVITTYTEPEVKTTPLGQKLLASAINRILPMLSLTHEAMIASQGYQVEINDMHGKPKQVSYFPQAKDGKVSNTPISWVRYDYLQTERKVQDGQTVAVLRNDVPVIHGDRGGVADLRNDERRVIGVDAEMFADAREHAYEDRKAPGIQLNFMLEGGVFPFFSGLPIPLARSNKVLRTHVMNKIIHRAGIMASTSAFDGSSIVKTTNELWDANTGEVVMTTVNNNFDAPVYTYQIPAYFQYPGMGPAYRSAGTSFNFAEVINVSNNLYRAVVPPAVEAEFAPGDEFIVKGGGARAVLTSSGPGASFFYCEQPLGRGDKLYLYRSGRRNLLTAKVGHITGLTDPVRNRNVDNCQTEIRVPAQCDQ
jgi:hypothetical protein